MTPSSISRHLAIIFDETSSWPLNVGNGGEGAPSDVATVRKPGGGFQCVHHGSSTLVPWSQHPKRREIVLNH
jgi:hypothetical protein